MLSRLSPFIAAMAMLIPSLATAEEAAAQAAPDAVLEAISAELERARVLLDALEPAPYFISIQAIEQERVGIVGEEGGLQGWAPSRGRWVHADVRLGTPELDSTHALRDGSYDEGGTGGRALPVGDDPAVLQLAVWEEVDVAYRAAVERMERVEADRQILVEEETFFDLAPVEAFVDVAEIPGMDVDIDVWEATIRRASAVFAESQVAIDPSVSLSVDRDTRWFVSTEGAKIRTTARRARVDISADTVANDGSWLSVHEAFDAESPAGLPSPDELADAVRQSVRELAALREAPEEEPFVGPAILSGRASAVFFHEIFGHRVEGHRLKQVSDAQTFRNRIGEEILPSFLSVHDDPTLPQYVEQDLRGHYDFDDQGVRAERVPLVEAGVLKGFLQSRSTVGEGALSNAHGRRQHALGEDVDVHVFGPLRGGLDSEPLRHAQQRRLGAVERLHHVRHEGRELEPDVGRLGEHRARPHAAVGRDELAAGLRVVAVLRADARRLEGVEGARAVGRVVVPTRVVVVRGVAAPLPRLRRGRVDGDEG